MKKTRKVISLLLVVATVAAMLSVGIVAGNAEGEAYTVTGAALRMTEKVKAVLSARTAPDAFGQETPTEPAPYDGVLVIADGVTYAFRQGDEFIYTYYLSIPESVQSLQAKTVYMTEGLELRSEMDDEATFPILGDDVVANERPEGTIHYNCSSPMKGKDFTAEDSVLITVKFLVTAESGTYTIDTTVLFLAGPNKHIFIYNGEKREDITTMESKLYDKDGSVKKPYSGAVPDEPTEPPVQVLLGDADGDGKVDIFDASSIQKSIAGTKGYPDYSKMDQNDRRLRIADVDGDGKVDIFDASLIQKYIAGSAVARSYGIGEPIE